MIKLHDCNLHHFFHCTQRHEPLEEIGKLKRKKKGGALSTSLSKQFRT